MKPPSRNNNNEFTFGNQKAMADNGQVVSIVNRNNNTVSATQAGKDRKSIFKSAANSDHNNSNGNSNDAQNLQRQRSSPNAEYNVEQTMLKNLNSNSLQPAEGGLGQNSSTHDGPIKISKHSSKAPTTH